MYGIVQCSLITMELPQPPPSSTITTAVSIDKNTGYGAIILGKYKLGRLLGRGSFAKVYQAQSLVDHTSVAVKVIDKSKIITTEMEPRIIREVSAMRRLHHHPNILKLHEVMATKSKIYLVMEIAKGGELFTKIVRHGRLTELAARRYFQQLISALRFCHENGVAHRDMKPQNLLLDHDGNLKIADFGLSALPEQLKDGLLDTACGTPAYTAPEVLNRHGSCNGYDGEKADAWSCGVILYVFLAGHMPFDDSNLMDMYKKIHRRKYQFPAWISKSARSVIAQLLDPNPETRLTIKALIDHNWFKKSLQSINPKCSSMFQSINCTSTSKSQSMNAFDLISLSSGLDLSGLFEAVYHTKQRFTTKAKMEVIEERVREVGGRLGFGVESEKNGRFGLAKGRLVLLIEVMEVTECLLMVDLKFVNGGFGDFEENDWSDLKIGFGDLVISWHNDVN